MTRQIQNEVRMDIESSFLLFVMFDIMFTRHICLI